MADVVDLGHEVGAAGRPHDRMIAAIAARQQGIIARRQLVELGLGRGRFATGWWLDGCTESIEGSTPSGIQESWAAAGGWRRFLHTAKTRCPATEAPPRFGASDRVEARAST